MYENTTMLYHLMLRRDRMRIILWLIGVMALTIGFGAAVPGMYPTQTDRFIMAETMKNPAMIAMVGPVYDGGGYTIGALYSNFMVLWTAVIMGIMNIFLIVRHTRQDEELGRLDVIRSLPVGRLSTLSAALVTSVIVNFIFAACIGICLAVLGIESMDITGCVLYGITMGAIGLTFAAVTAVFCQLCASPLTAAALSFAFLAVAFMVRAAGDIQSELIACLSPLGLILRTKTFVANAWWPIPVTIAVSFTAAIVALKLCAARDMGEGIIPARPGKRNAAPYLKSAGGLAWRLLRSPVIIWALILLMIGAAYGSIMGDLEAFISTNELFKSLFPDGDSAHFVSFLAVIMSILGVIPILQFILKASSQESGGFAENVLARAVSRHNLLWGYFLIALLAGVFIPVLNAAGFWLGSVPVMDTPIPFATLFQVSIVYVPAMWFMLGVAMLLIAFLPRFTFVAWVYLGYTFFILYIGSVMNLPGWMSDLSPFEHIPKLPMDEFSASGIAVLTAISAVMSALGFIGYRRRDMRLS